MPPLPIPTGKDLQAISPQLILAVVGMLVLLLDAIWPKISKKGLANLSILGLTAAGIAAWRLWPTKGEAAPAMQGMVIADPYALFFTIVFVVGAALSILLSVNYLEREGGNQGEYYVLILFTTLGAIVMAQSLNLICVFIGLEILSISLYILAGYQTERLESDEAALKYFLLGAFASAFFLYGIALVYGATGHLDLPSIVTQLSDVTQGGVAPGAKEPSKDFLLLGGVAMLLVGFGFKVAVVPFHIWTPDVYEGAPTSVTAFMSVSAKAAGFAAFLRVMAAGLQDQNLQFQISAVLASIAALTMLVGNVVAVVQPSLKRMLSYSSIAHAGYMLVGVVAAVRPGGGGFLMMGGADPRGQAVSAVLFYALVYTVSNLGAFGVIMALRKKGHEVQTVSDLAGVGARYPLLAAAMSLFMLSLAGLPPTAGFFGKLFIIRALVGMNATLVWLMVLLALTSAVSFYYYLGVVRAMYFDKPEEGEPLPVLSAGGHMRTALVLTAIGSLAFGLWAGGAFSAAQKVAEGFFRVPPPITAMK